MNRYEAHATDEWQRDTLVIQVRRVTDTGRTAALAQVLEDLDEMPAMMFEPYTEEQARGQESVCPTPGIRMPREAAIALAQEVIRATGAPSDPSEVARLQETVDQLTEERRVLLGDCDRLTAQRDMARRDVDMLELLVEARDAHLEREARLGTVFLRGLEMEQGKAEVAAERENHPARSIQDSINDSLTRVARTVKGN